MIIELNESEVLNALKSQFGFPSHATLNVTVGRKDNGSKFVVDIPTIKDEVIETKEETHLFSGHEDFGG